MVSGSFAEVSGLLTQRTQRLTDSVRPSVRQSVPLLPLLGQTCPHHLSAPSQQHYQPQRHQQQQQLQLHSQRPTETLSSSLPSLGCAQAIALSPRFSHSTRTERQQHRRTSRLHFNSVSESVAATPPTSLLTSRETRELTSARLKSQPAQAGVAVSVRRVGMTPRRAQPVTDWH